MIPQRFTALLIRNIENQVRFVGIIRLFGWERGLDFCELFALYEGLNDFWLVPKPR